MTALKVQKSYVPKGEVLKPQWHLIDASERPLGRMAVDIARFLQGKHRPTYAPHVLTGDIVVVVNAARLKVTGNKLATKVYYRHSGYPGGFRETTLQEQMERDPRKVVIAAVKGMLPKNTLGQRMLRRLHVYTGLEHPHQGQIAQTKPTEKLGMKPEESGTIPQGAEA